ncbi:MAG: hypothetical protein RR540_02460 [Oscillospiraceae bacterium]
MKKIDLKKLINKLIYKDILAVVVGAVEKLESALNEVLDKLFSSTAENINFVRNC